jgi:hypothetical protein
MAQLPIFWNLPDVQGRTKVKILRMIRVDRLPMKAKML